MNFFLLHLVKQKNKKKLKYEVGFFEYLELNYK